MVVVLSLLSVASLTRSLSSRLTNPLPKFGTPSEMNHQQPPPPPSGSRQGSMGPPPPPGRLWRYGSAPGSFLSGNADSVLASTGGAPGEYSLVPPVAYGSMAGRYFTADSTCLTSESNCRVPDRQPSGLQHGAPHGLQEERLHAPADLASKVGVASPAAAAAAVVGCGGSPLVRHSSSPAGFFSHIFADSGPSTSREIGNYSQGDTSLMPSLATRRLMPQWSFSRQDSLSQISDLSILEMGENGGGNSSDEAVGHVSQSYISSDFHLGSWDEGNSIAFSAPSGKRVKDNSGSIVTNLSNMGTQFNLSKNSLEASSVENLFQINQDTVPCRVRAKRGCATHPRSIAERDRRTRISKRLKKLEDLVPNMDKQTSTSDMLELAIQHIKELQSEVEKLKQEQANCTCGAKHEKT